MKRVVKLLVLPIVLFSLAGCDLIQEVFGGDKSGQHSKEYSAITGKFVLHDATDERCTYTDTYFEFDGSKGNFSMKYYENGALKREGVFQKIVTREEKIGQVDDNLHFNVKVGKNADHISTYTESLDPINQFRIIEEYYGTDQRYYLSELPYVMGTYVREGVEYKEESAPTTEENYLIPTLGNFTNALNGFYRLDNDHYFYFMSPGINSYYAKAYFQYYSPSLEKPLEGFVTGITYLNTSGETRLNFTYSRQILIYTSKPDDQISLLFGYYSVDSSDRLVEHWGTVDFSDGVLNSFTFEHLSRQWTDEEMDTWTKDINYHLPDPIIYDYIGGTYTKN